MKILALALSAFVGIGLGALAAEVPLDVAFRTDGQIIPGRVAGVETLFLKFNIQPAAGQPKSTLSIPLIDLDHVDFGEREAVEKFLSVASVERSRELERLWRERESLLKVPDSTAGAFALKLADFLLGVPAAGSRDWALQLFQRVERDDWSVRRRAEASLGRLRALVILGRGPEAVAEAEQLSRWAEDPRVQIEAKYLLAEVSFQRLIKLEAASPRQVGDETGSPQREEVINQTLDLYLFPAVFFGSEQELASRGLLRAIEVLHLAGNNEAAVARASDLVVSYPGTAAAEKAKTFLPKPGVNNGGL